MQKPQSDKVYFAACRWYGNGVNATTWSTVILGKRTQNRTAKTQQQESKSKMMCCPALTCIEATTEGIERLHRKERTTPRCQAPLGELHWQSHNSIAMQDGQSD